MGWRGKDKKFKGGICEESGKLWGKETELRKRKGLRNGKEGIRGCLRKSKRMRRFWDGEARIKRREGGPVKKVGSYGGKETELRKRKELWNGKVGIRGCLRKITRMRSFWDGEAKDQKAKGRICYESGKLWGKGNGIETEKSVMEW